MHSRRRRAFKPNKKHALLFILALCFIAGFTAGLILANGMESMRYAQVSDNLSTYLLSFHTPRESISEALKISIFKHARLIVIIWLLAFIPPGGFAVSILLLLKGMGYGFTAALFFKNYGAAGLLTNIMITMPQLLCMIPAYFFISYVSVNYVLVHSERKKIHQKGDHESLSRYACTLLIGLGLAILAALLDTSVVPMLMSML